MESCSLQILSIHHEKGQTYNYLWFKFKANLDLGRFFFLHNFSGNSYFCRFIDPGDYRYQPADMQGLPFLEQLLTLNIQWMLEAIGRVILTKGCLQSREVTRTPQEIILF